MSTKIYVAYRVKEGVDLWTLLNHLKPTAVEEVRHVLRTMGINYIKSDLGKEKAKEKTGGFLTPWDVYSWLYSNYVAQLSNDWRDTFDFDVGLEIYYDQGRYYIIPRSDMFMRYVWDFLAKEPTLDDFAYWNNTDRQDGVSEAEWNRRCEVWDRIFEGLDPMKVSWSVCNKFSFARIFDANHSFAEHWKKLGLNQDILLRSLGD